MVGCAFGVLWMSASASAQCADGSVEEVLAAGRVVGCAGAWNDPGIVEADGTPVDPACSLRAGNDGELSTIEEMVDAGARCTAADLCGLGWSLCGDEDVIDATTCRAASAAGDASVYIAATASCSGDLGAQVVGCGALGCASDLAGDVCSVFNRQSYGPAEDPCATLNRTGCSDGTFIDAGWSCFTEGGGEPVTNVIKSHAEGGGVLCCFREICDCVDEDGICYADGEEPEACVVCEKGEEPGVPLTRIEECAADAGVGDGDAGADADSGVDPTVDLGPGPNGPDGGETDPGITFRGDGGCECRTAGDGAPTFGFLALALFALRRRR